MIGIVNYGSGNIYAIANIYKRLDIPFELIDDPAQLNKADKLILPGVGAFDETMQLLNDSGLKTKLDELVVEKEVPIIGVCVGMQILAASSDEGTLPGFGWINGVVKKLEAAKLNHKPHLPHLGWNSIAPLKEEALFDNVDTKRGFYFLHTYYMSCEQEEDVLCQTDYGGIFASAVKHKNVYGVQFHPEKSHSNGIELFRNFAKL